MPGSINSQSCFTYAPIQIGNYTATNLNSIKVTVLNNHCDYPITFQSYRADSELYGWGNDYRCFQFGTTNAQVNANDCSQISIANAGIITCHTRLYTQNDCSGFWEVEADLSGASDVRYGSTAITWDIHRRYQLFNMGQGNRHITIAYQGITNGTFNANSSSSVLQTTSWDGVTPLSVETFDGNTLNLISANVEACPDLSSKTFVIDRLAPFDGYLINNALINTIGNSFPTLFGIIGWDVSGNVRYNPTQIDNYVDVMAVSFTNDQSTVNYRGVDECKMLEDLRINNQGVKEQYNNVFFFDNLNLAQNAKFASTQKDFTHLLYGDQTYLRYSSTLGYNVITQYGYVVSTNGMEYQIGYVTSGITNTTNQCYYYDQSGAFHIGGLSMSIFLANGTSIALSCSFNTGTWLYVVGGTNTYGCFPVQTIEYANASLCLNSNNTLSLIGTANPSQYLFRMNPETTSSVTFSIESTQTLNWNQQYCCPVISSITDDPTDEYVTINAYSSCISGNAIVTEQGADVTDTLQTYYLTSTATEYYYKRAYNTSGTVTLSLCCGSKCVSKAVILTNFPNLSQLNESDVGGGSDIGTNAAHSIDGGFTFNPSNSEYCGDIAGFIHICSSNYWLIYFLCWKTSPWYEYIMDVARIIIYIVISVVGLWLGGMIIYYVGLVIWKLAHLLWRIVKSGSTPKQTLYGGMSYIPFIGHKFRTNHKVKIDEGQNETRTFDTSNDSKVISVSPRGLRDRTRR
jgi:hypothetical protein